MLPSTHTPIASKYSNWGYICFFGCIALLVTLLFFAISQVKQADEVRRTQPAPATAVTPVVSSEPTPAVGGNSLIETGPFVYTNSDLGFSIDFLPVLQVFMPNQAIATKVRSTKQTTSGGGSVQYTIAGDQSCEGEPCNVLNVSWVNSAGRTIEQIEAEGRIDIVQYGSDFPPKIERQVVAGNSIVAIEYPDASGLCDGRGEVSGKYQFLRKGFLITVSTRCGAIDLVNSLKFSN
jgi:hypothetical protein